MRSSTEKYRLLDDEEESKLSTCQPNRIQKTSNRNQRYLKVILYVVLALSLSLNGLLAAFTISNLSRVEIERTKFGEKLAQLE